MAFPFHLLCIVITVFSTVCFFTKLADDLKAFERIKSYEKKIKTCGRFLAYEKNLKAAHSWFAQEKVLITKEQKNDLEQHIKEHQPKEQSCSSNRYPLVLHLQPSPYGPYWPNWVFYVHLKRSHYDFLSPFRTLPRSQNPHLGQDDQRVSFREKSST